MQPALYVRCSGLVTYNVTLLEQTSRRKRDLSPTTITTSDTFIITSVAVGKNYTVSVITINSQGMPSNTSNPLVGYISPLTVIAQPQQPAALTQFKQSTEEIHTVAATASPSSRF